MDLSNSCVIHVKKGDIEYLQFRRLLQYEDKISHCFSLIGNSNNYQVNDGRNYPKLLECINLDYKGLVSIKNQIHSDIVKKVDIQNENYIEIDGLVTNKRGITIATREADCTPILLYDPVQNVVGNIHSGWRGTTKKICQKAIKMMIEEYKCEVTDIICLIGPCIGKCHFEVDEDVKEIFVNTFPNMKNCIEKTIIKEGKQKYNIDTTKINIELMKETGIKEENIENCNICTVCKSKNIHSFRATKDNSGRNTAIIGLK